MIAILANGSEIPVVRASLNYNVGSSEYQLNIDVSEAMTLPALKKAFTKDGCKTITIKRTGKSDKTYEGFELTDIAENISEDAFGLEGASVRLKKAD